MKLKRTKFKNIFYLCLLLSLTISTSCSKDEEDEQEFSIIGTWNIDKFTVWWENSTTGELIEGPDSDLNAGTFVFNENNTGTGVFIEDDENFSFAFTWTLLGDKLTINAEDDNLSAEYSIAEKSLDSLKLSFQGLLSENTLEIREIYLSKYN